MKEKLTVRKGFEYPMDVIEVLFSNDTKHIDINYVYSNFDSNLNYIIENKKHCLNERELDMFLKYYVEGNTLEHIAKDYYVTRERARQIISKATLKFKNSSTLYWIEVGKEVCMLQDDIVNIKKELMDELALLQKQKKEHTFENIILPQNEALKLEKIEYLDLSVRANNCLKRACIKTIGDLCCKSIDDMMRIRNL